MRVDSCCICVKLITSDSGCNTCYCNVSGAFYNLPDILKVPRRLLTERGYIWWIYYKQPAPLERYGGFPLLRNRLFLLKLFVDDNSGSRRGRKG